MASQCRGCSRRREKQDLLSQRALGARSGGDVDKATTLDEEEKLRVGKDAVGVVEASRLGGRGPVGVGADDRVGRT